ncbi:MAG: pantetheine-phosphate adenylyltransferase [Saprospiraceae bacterium]|nr:pantetheine-phosphate adenylyltransferase [Saprospiraceae bacterium]
MKIKRIVFPGSFDPITKGHVDLVQRAIPLFDEIIIAIGVNTQKKYLFSLEKRIEWLNELFKNEKKIKVDHFQGLTLEYCKLVKANYILRGIRNAADFDYERTISQINHTVSNNLETIFLISRPELSHVSSTIVRELILGNGDISFFVPKQVYKDIQKLTKK